MKSKILTLILPGILLLFLTSGCFIKDELTNKKSFVKIELTGPLKNGVFSIETEGPDTNFIYASGLISTNTETNLETALLTFQDDTQELYVTFAFPTKTGLNELVYDEIDEYISVTFLNEELILVSKIMSLNISKFEKKENLLSGYSGTFKARGTFTGTAVYVDVVTNEEYIHILTGEFEYHPF